MLDATEQATLLAVLDRLIPADETGPGAIDAGVAVYVERALAGPYAASVPAYREGIAALDAATGTPFVDLPPAEQDAVLASFSTSADPRERGFFDLARQHAIEGMFGDPLHGGNAGHAGWKLLGYPGVRPVLPAEHQALDVVVTPAWEEAAGA